MLPRDTSMIDLGFSSDDDDEDHKQDGLWGSDSDYETEDEEEAAILPPPTEGLVSVPFPFNDEVRALYDVLWTSPQP